MKLTIFVIFGLILAACASQTPPPASSIPQPVVYKNYVSLDLEYPTYKKLYDQLIKKVGPLKNRGEAHVTLITPPEYKILTETAGTQLTPEKIHTFFKNAAPSEKDFTKLCIGQGNLKKDKKTLKTYFVVIKSDRLRKLREELFVQSGLNKNQFDPDLFFPHITLGFTDRDLYYEDGVMKTVKSCRTKLQMKL